MDPALWELLRTDERHGEVEAVLRLVHPDAAVPGVRVVARFGDVVTCRLRGDTVTEVRSDPRCRSLKAARMLGPEPERAPPTGDGDPRETDVRRPPGLPLTGAGVVVGVVDWDCAFAHESFIRDGTTRLLALWDQRGGHTTESPEAYGYGRCYTARQIGAALREPDPYRALGYRPGAVGHGTHVMDIAAGNGAVGPAGIAVDADLVFVHVADRDTDGLHTLGDSVRILEGVDFVARTAGARPWVANLSMGRHGGPHDGSTLTELAFDNLLRAAPNRFIVQSCGNYADRSIHVTATVAAGRTTCLTVSTLEDDVTPNEVELWYSGGDIVEVQTRSPTGERSSWARLGERVEIVHDGAVVGRLYHRFRDPNNGDNHVDLFLDPHAPAGAWCIAVRGVRVIDGRLHGWVERDEACSHCQARFTGPAVDRAVTIGTIASSRLPLIVGAYDAHDPSGPIAGFSSSGPTRDGRAKPDLVAPGVDVLAAAVPTGLVRKSGSSMASPHVAGAVALCLQAATVPLSAARIRELLLDSAHPVVRDVDQGSRYGAGHLDVSALAELMTKESVMTRLSTSAAFDPDRVYESLVYGVGGSDAVGDAFDVVALPGEVPRRRPAPGDRLVRVELGEPGLGQVAMLSDAMLASDPTLIAPATPAEASGPGYYATVMRPTGPAFAWRVLDEHARMPVGQLLLRPKPGGLGPELPETAESDDVATMVRAGLAENQITNALFYARNPKLTGTTLRPGTAAAREWLAIRDNEVRPAIRRAMPRGSVDPAELATFLSQYEDDKRVPAEVKKRFLTEPALVSAGRSLRDRVIANWRGGHAPLRPGRLYELAFDLAGDAGDAALLCHNVTKAFVREGTAIFWKGTGREGEYTDGQRTHTAKLIHPAGRLTYFHKGKGKAVRSIFYLLFSARSFGTDDPGDWYHYFVTATMTAYGSTGGLGGGSGASGRREEEDRGGGVTPAVYVGVLTDAIATLEQQLTDPKLRGAPGYRGWVLANVLSFLEGGYYGKDYTQDQSDVARESKVHLYGAVFGLRTIGGRPGTSWRWHVPKAGSLSKEDLVLGFTVADKTAEVWTPEGRVVPTEEEYEIPAPEAAEAPLPKHVRRARELWARHLTRPAALTKVTIQDIAAAPSTVIRTSTFDAWTNSPTAVYVAATADDAPGKLLAVLYHESLHVVQFAGAGGRPPDRYATMMRYEVQAYEQTAEWANRHADPDVRALTEPLAENAATFRTAVVKVEKTTKDPVEQEKLYRDFLVSGEWLPPHERLAELYRPTRRPAKEDEPESEPLHALMIRA